MLFKRIEWDVAGHVQPLPGANTWQAYLSVMDAAQYCGVLRGLSQARAFYVLGEDGSGSSYAMSAFIPEQAAPEEQEVALASEVARLADMGLIVTHVAVPEIARAYAVHPDRADFDWRH